MIPNIRCGLTAEGHVEACAVVDSAYRVVVDRCTRNVIYATVREGTDEFRWLVRAARKHCHPA
jgi:hypothetical protein